MIGQNGRSVSKGIGVGPLINAHTLQARLQAGKRTVILDVRWSLGDPHGLVHFKAGHLPGAVFVDLAADLAGPHQPLQGRHPLPSAGAFQDAARRWGIRTGDRVVAYDDSGNLAAARLWWMLRDAGVHVHLLDGGLAAWRAAGLPLEMGTVLAEPGDILLGSGLMPVIDADATAGFSMSGMLLDARAGERYRGEVEPLDPRAGHIPGAVSAPTSENIGPDGLFLSASELRERFAEMGITEEASVAVYCGSGVTAAHQIAALEVAGISAALFPGSFSAWSSDPERLVATGPTPR